MLQVRLNYSNIIAPIACRVGLRLVDPGNVVQAVGTTVLAVITQMQPTTVIFRIAEDSLGQVQARMRQVHTLPVEAMDRSQTTRIATGKLFAIDSIHSRRRMERPAQLIPPAPRLRSCAQ